VYGRLRTVARELSVEVPGLGSLVELAASGNVEALSRVAELAGASAGDNLAEGEMAEGLGAIARSAPEDLVLALRAASDKDREAATTLLARGLVQTGEADHPFWKALRKSLAAPDPKVAEFSRSLEGLMSRKVAEAKAPRAEPPLGTPVLASPPVIGTGLSETRPGG
jgi:D-alanyl-D-alanine carboxypeptidase/D-alanyl-D-alanine-endopeptidase (penicillin-binding protein 4)